MEITPNQIVHLATTILGHGSLNVTQARNFRAIFGVSPKACSIIWNFIKYSVPCSCLPHYLLWALIFMKGYHTEQFNAALVRTDPKTFRKWVWIILKAISNLNLVRVIFYFIYRTIFQIIFLILFTV